MTILELAHQTGIHPKWVASTAGGEYHSACPACGGTDRFYIQPHRPMSKCDGYYSCRQCGSSGDAIQFARQFLNLSFQEAAQAVNATTQTIISPILNRAHAPHTVTLHEPPPQWIAQATDYITQAHKQILLQKNALDFLASRGLPIEAIQRYNIGWSVQDRFLPRHHWGLEEQHSADGNPRKLWLPKGIIIPIGKPTGQIIRLKIRRHDWKQGDTLPK